jgi:hypothetical protein
MNRRILLVVIALPSLLLLVGAVWWAIAPDPLEDLANEVRAGMTQTEAEQVLGKPTFDNTYPEGGTMWNKWVTDRIIILVDFDHNGRVERAVVHRRPLWDRIYGLRK